MSITPTGEDDEKIFADIDARQKQQVPFVQIFS